MPRPNRGSIVIYKPFGARAIVDAVTVLLRRSQACYDLQPNRGAL